MTLEPKISTTTFIPTDLHELGLVKMNPSELTYESHEHLTDEVFTQRPKILKPTSKLYNTFQTSYIPEMNSKKQKALREDMRRFKRYSLNPQHEEGEGDPSIEYLRKKQRRKKHRRTKDSTRQKNKNRYRNNFHHPIIDPYTTTTSTSTTTTTTTTTTSTTTTPPTTTTVATTTLSTPAQTTEVDHNKELLMELEEDKILPEDEFRWQPFSPELINFIVALLVFAIRSVFMNFTFNFILFVLTVGYLK